MGTSLMLWSQTTFTYYCDVIMSTIVFQITSLTIVISTVYSGAGKIKRQSSASLVFVRGIHRWPVNSPHKGPVTRKMFPFDDVITHKLYLITNNGLSHFESILNRLISHFIFWYKLTLLKQGLVLLQRSEAVAILSANGSAAFKESCAPIG